MADLPIGQAIRDVRQHRQMNKRQLAVRMGCEHTYIWKIESGRNLPNLDSLLRFAEALEIEPWRLLRRACRMKDKMEAPDAVS